MEHAKDFIYVDESPTERKTGKDGSFVITTAALALCTSSGVVYTFSNPAAPVGPAGATLICCILFICGWLTLDFTIKSLNPSDGKLGDELIIGLYPKFKYPILFLSRASAFILNGAYAIGNFLYMQGALQTLWFQYTDISHVNQTIIVFFFMAACSMILNRKFAALISSLGLPVPIFNVAAVIYFGMKHSTPETRQCFKDSFRHPSNYGLFKSDYKAAIVGGFQLASQFASTYYCHNLVPILCLTARTPKHNRRNATFVIIGLFIIYMISMLVGMVPYACYGTSSQYMTAPPSDYVTSFGNNKFGLAVSVIYLIGLFSNTPYTYSVLRDMAFQWIDWTGKRFLRFVVDVSFNIVILIFSALIYYYNVSIQDLLQIGGFSCIVIWMAIIPVFWHVYHNRHGIYNIILNTFAVCVAIFLILIEILQFRV